MSLEKCMFFLPNRLTIRLDKIFVSFDISAIPVDMHVTRMVLRLPLPAADIPNRMLLAQLIASGWDEQLMQTGFQPPHPVTLVHKMVDPSLIEEEVDLTQYAYQWRFNSISNHGVYLELINHGGVTFSNNTCPFLIVETL